MNDGTEKSDRRIVNTPFPQFLKICVPLHKHVHSKDIKRYKKFLWETLLNFAGIALQTA